MKLLGSKTEIVKRALNGSPSLFFSVRFLHTHFFCGCMHGQHTLLVHVKLLFLTASSGNVCYDFTGK